MALIVEDGTGKADAESYISVADASAYHTNRGNAAWAALASDTVREQCLRRATDFMEQLYRNRWLGIKFTTTQALSWPRQVVPVRDAPLAYYVPNNTIPEEVKRACAELALKASTEDLAPDLERSERRVKTGPVEVEYEPNSPQAKQYRAVEMIVRIYLRHSGPTIGLQRC